MLGLVVLAAAVTGGIALAGDLSAQPAPTPASKASVLPAELAQHFAVLSEGTASGVASIGSAGVESQAAIEESSEGINAQFGVSASLAREVAWGSQHVWVIPGSTGICIHDFETGSGVCGPTAHATAGDITLDVGGNENGITGGGTIYGLAPNGNQTVAVHDANGSTEDVPVEHNIYIINHPGAVSVDLVDGTGKRQTVELPG